MTQINNAKLVRNDGTKSLNKAHEYLMSVQRKNVNRATMIIDPSTPRRYSVLCRYDGNLT